MEVLIDKISVYPTLTRLSIAHLETNKKKHNQIILQSEFKNILILKISYQNLKQQ